MSSNSLSFSLFLSLYSILSLFLLEIHEGGSVNYFKFHQEEYQTIVKSYEDLNQTHAKVLYTALRGPSEINATFTSRGASVRNRALLLEINQGILLNNGVYATVLDPNQKVAYTFNCWENSLPTIERNFTEIVIDDDIVVSLMVPYGFVFSHITVTILSKLNFSCPFLTTNKVTILVPTKLGKEMVLWVCPGAINAKFLLGSDLHKRAGSEFWALVTKKIVWPLYLGPFSVNNDVSHLPPMTMSVLNDQKFLKNSTRTIVYMPRPPGWKRYVANQAEILSKICEVVSQVPDIELHVFTSSNNPALDRSHPSLLNARVVISPHSGAMANFFFVPQDTSIIEFVDLDLGNWFFLFFASMLGLEYRNVKPLIYSQNSYSVPVVVNVDDVLGNLFDVLPQLKQIHPNKTFHLPDMNFYEKKRAVGIRKIC